MQAPGATADANWGGAPFGRTPQNAGDVGDDPQDAGGVKGGAAFPRLAPGPWPLTLAQASVAVTWPCSERMTDVVLTSVAWQGGAGGGFRSEMGLIEPAVKFFSGF